MNEIDYINEFIKSPAFALMSEEVKHETLSKQYELAKVLVDSKIKEILAQVRKSVDSPPGMLTEDHHHTVHEERQVCYSSHLRPKSLHL